MTDTTYNGWTNYETWCLNLWQDNERGTHDYWREVAQECWNAAESSQYWTREETAVFALADRMKDETETAKDDMLEQSGQASSMWADLIGAALSEVNWREIAQHLVDDCEQTPTEGEEHPDATPPT